MKDLKTPEGKELFQLIDSNSYTTDEEDLIWALQKDFHSDNLLDVFAASDIIELMEKYGVITEKKEVK